MMKMTKAERNSGIVTIFVFVLIFSLTIIYLWIRSNLSFFQNLRLEFGFAESIAVVITAVFEILSWGYYKMILASRERQRTLEEAREEGIKLGRKEGFEQGKREAKEERNTSDLYEKIREDLYNDVYKQIQKDLKSKKRK